MRISRRGGVAGGVVAGVSMGVAAILGSWMLGAPSPASAGTTYHHMVKPESVDATPVAALVKGERAVVGAAGAGSYVVQRVDDHLAIVQVRPASGWRFDVLHNDAGLVKVVFSNGVNHVFAVGKLKMDSMLEVVAFEKAIPQPVVPVVAKVKSTVKAGGVFDDDDHDGWCDHDGDFGGAGFDGDKGGDRDGGRHHHRRHRDF